MIIYKATNIINNKIYVGQTIKTLRKRSLEHKADSKRNKYLFPKAIKKYGFENFKWEVLERCSTQQELDIAEIKWINKLQSNSKQIGYNISKGGNPGKEIGQKTLSKFWKSKEFREKMKMATREGARKLTKNQVQEIKTAYKMGFKPKVLELYYNLSNSGIQSIVYNKTWKDITPTESLPESLLLDLTKIKTTLTEQRKRTATKGPRILTKEQISKMRFFKSLGVPHSFWVAWYSISKSLSEKIYSGEKFADIKPSCRESIPEKEFELIWMAVIDHKIKAKEQQAKGWFRRKV